MTQYYLNLFLDNLSGAAFVVIGLFFYAIIWVATRGGDDE